MTSSLESLSSEASFRLAFTTAVNHLVTRTPTPSILLMAAANAVLLKDEVLIKLIEARYRVLAPAFDGVSQDAAILARAMEGGLASKQPVDRLIDEVWRLHTNAFRSARPPREAARIATTIEQPFDPAHFHFGRVPHEVFLTGHVGNVSVDWLFSKYPLTSFHALVVPDLAQMLPQLLSAKYHHFAAQTLHSLPRGSVIGYNSLGASASVNQLHFQVVVAAGPQPFLDSRWEKEPYPAPFKSFVTPVDAWQYIDQLHQNNQPYNVVYESGGIHVWSRRYQGAFTLADWTTAPAWYEMAGNFVVDGPRQLESVSAEMVSALLRDASLV